MPWRSQWTALGGIEASPAGDRETAGELEAYPQAGELICEIGTTIAGFLALAVAVNLILDALGR
ncbi:hypothetical protein [Azospirillum sp. sgz301742]